MVQYGYFDDSAKEYIITRPDTPRSWSNYLGSTEYGAIITNNAGGYSFYKSAAQGRFVRLRFNSVPMDQPGRYFYLRDMQSADFWSASWQPVGKSLADYKARCRHGTAYTVIESSYAGISTETSYFVPLGRDFEIWLLRVTNDSPNRRELRAFSFVEYANEWNVLHDQSNLQYSQYIVDCSYADGMIGHAMCPNLKQDLQHFENRDQSSHSFLALVAAEASGFDTDREAFLGVYGSYAAPQAVVRGECSGSLAYGDNACGALQIDVPLEPGESRELMVVMGVGQSECAGRAAVDEFSSPAVARQALDELKRHWHSRLTTLIGHSPDPDFDSMLNVWTPYNCQITFAWSRAASLVYSGERDGLGYRDTVQDMLGVITSIPREAVERLQLMITGQLSNGGAMPVVKQFAHRPGHESAPPEDEYRADDCLWLFDAVPAFVKESGDLGFLDRILPFADHGEATVREHLRRALEFNLKRRGAHGLPCGLSADWNDTLRLGQHGESTFVALQLRHALRVYVEISVRLGHNQERDWASAQLALLDAAIQNHAWDGEWFNRGFLEDGTPIGARSCSEGSIFLNPQSWAVISGAATGQQAIRAMDAVANRLATEYGLLLCDPPFTRTDPTSIRAPLFNPGLKENGSIFCHPQGWAVIAEALLGRGDRAYEYCRAYLPAAYNERAEIREIEPYVFCQSAHGRASRRFGASRLPWLTGTATWSYLATTQYILGIRPDYDGLRIAPVIPTRWPGFRVERSFRGARYAIEVHNRGGVQRGVRELTCDGVEVDPERPLAPAEPGSVVRVVARLG